MAKTRSEKDALLARYVKLLENYDGFILVDASNIDNNSVTVLKKELKALGAEYSVVKNSLFKIALQDKNLPAQTVDFDGSSAVISYKEDPTVVAKALKKVQKEKELLSSKYGFVESKYIEGEKASSLADIPTKPELLAKLLGSFNASITGFVGVTSGNIAGFTRALNGLAQK